MDDFGDILFYIIAAVIGLATTFGKKKKKKAGVPLPAETDSADNQDDNFAYDEEMVGVEYQVDSEDFMIQQSDSEELIEPEKVAAFDPILEEKYGEPLARQFENEGKTQFVEEKYKVEKLEDTESEEDEEEDILSDFDLRKAVIFSEILDRKDY